MVLEKISNDLFGLVCTTGEKVVPEEQLYELQPYLSFVGQYMQGTKRGEDFPVIENNGKLLAIIARSSLDQTHVYFIYRGTLGLGVLKSA